MTWPAIVAGVVIYTALVGWAVCIVKSGDARRRDNEEDWRP